MSQKVKRVVCKKCSGQGEIGPHQTCPNCKGDKLEPLRDNKIYKKLLSAQDKMLRANNTINELQRTCPHTFVSKKAMYSALEGKLGQTFFQRCVCNSCKKRWDEKYEQPK